MLFDNINESFAGGIRQNNSNIKFCIKFTMLVGGILDVIHTYLIQSLVGHRKNNSCITNAALD